MINNQVFVSVIMCVYNGEKYLKDSIQSVLDLDYENFEFIIVNDGSTDSSAEIISSFENKKIRYFFKKNSGLASTRNFAFKAAKGEWFAVIDQDDLVMKNRLILQTNIIKKHQEVKFIFGNTNIINENGKIIKKFFDDFTFLKKYEYLISKKAYYHLIADGCYIDSESWFMHREVFKKIGPLNKNLSYSCDFAFFLKASKIYDFYFSKEVVSSWRVHSKQESNTNQKIYYESILIYFSLLEFKNLKLNFLIFKIIIKNILLLLYKKYLK